MIAPAPSSTWKQPGIHDCCQCHRFPRACPHSKLRLREIEMSVAAGAAEVDIVISRRHV